jgi:hypothetical protein
MYVAHAKFRTYDLDLVDTGVGAHVFVKINKNAICGKLRPYVAYTEKRN